MDSSPLLLLLLLSTTLISTIHPTSSVHVCRPTRCNSFGYGPEIRFPFRLVGSHDPSCGYPGFDVSCNAQGQAIISLPSSGEFVVNWIEYSTQTMYINDPASCLADRISGFSADGSAFRAGPVDQFKFFNCSMDWREYSEIRTHAVRVVCNPVRRNMSLILALPVRDPIGEILASRCTLMPNVSIPLKLMVTETEYWSERVVVELTWTAPDCQDCELAGMNCGFKSNKGLEIGCTKPPNKTVLSRGAKYGIIVGVGIPGLVILIGLVCYAAGKFHCCNYHHHRDSHPTTSFSTATLQPPPSATVSGLDAPTIESYPKTVIGESRQLPSKVSDGTCPICLSEYQPKETLRSIPECNHYFHALCIDEWLQLNGSCPLCRTSLESKSVTSCSSSPSTFSISFSSPSSGGV